MTPILFVFVALLFIVICSIAVVLALLLYFESRKRAKGGVTPPPVQDGPRQTRVPPSIFGAEAVRFETATGRGPARPSAYHLATDQALGIDPDDRQSGGPQSRAAAAWSLPPGHRNAALRARSR